MAAFDLDPSSAISPTHDAVREALAEPETKAIDRIVAEAALPPDLRARIATDAAELIVEIRRARDKESAIEALMREYDLRSEEGIVLMCLAEALLRIPDDETRDKLIRDKIGPADWGHHLGRSPSPFVNASTWALAITGKA